MRMPVTREPVQIFVTVPSDEAGEAIAQMLVERRLAACAQVSGAITSFFWWKNKVDLARERLLLIKTFGDRFEAVASAICEKHPYKTPEILAMPIAYVTTDYLRWMEAGVDGPEQGV